MGTNVRGCPESHCQFLVVSVLGFMNRVHRKRDKAQASFKAGSLDRHPCLKKALSLNGVRSSCLALAGKPENVRNSVLCQEGGFLENSYYKPRLIRVLRGFHIACTAQLSKMNLKLI